MNRNDILEEVGQLLNIEGPYYRWAIIGLLHMWPCDRSIDGEPFAGEGLLLRAWDYAKTYAKEAPDVVRRACVIAERLRNQLHDDEKWDERRYREHFTLYTVLGVLVGVDDEAGVPLARALKRLDPVLEAALPLLSPEDRERASITLQRLRCVLA